MVIASFKQLTNGSNGTAASTSKRIKKSEIPENICLMPISVGQEYHIGEKGFATLKLLIDSKFSKIYIIVVDTLQALTIMAQEGCTAEEAMQKAISNGDEWIAWFEEQKRQEPALVKLPIEIIRWSIYSEESIRDERAVVEGWQRDNFKSFRKVLGSTAAGFLRGAVGQSDDLVDGDRVALYFNNSTEYLKRETAVAIKWQSQFVLANADKTIFLAYPKEPNPIIDFVLNKAETPYKLEVEVLVIRFNSPKLSAKKISPVTSKENEDMEPNRKPPTEYVSSDSEGSSPPEPSFMVQMPLHMEKMQVELGALRLQVDAIPVLQQQLQTLQQHVLFLYHTYVMTGAGNTLMNGTFMLPPPDRKLTPPLPDAEKAAVHEPAALPNGHGTRAGTPPPSSN